MEFYDNPTVEQIEENIEFIDWSLMPLNLITQDIKDMFSTIPGLEVVKLLQNIFDTYETMENNDTYPNTVFFLRGNKCYASFDRKNGKINFNYKEVYVVMQKKFGFDPRDNNKADAYLIDKLVKNVVKHQFGKEKATLGILAGAKYTEIQSFFCPPN